MTRLGSPDIMSTMIKESTAERVVLVSEKRSGDGMRDDVSIKRYRLARLKINQPRMPGDDRHAHLKEIYD